MKFTSLAVAALFLADSSAVLLNKQTKDDCGDTGCHIHHLSYDFDEPTLKKAEADDAAKTQHMNGATVADNNAKDAHAAATAAAADTAAAEAKADAAAAFAGTDYKNRPAFEAARAANEAAVHAKEAALDASLKAADDNTAK